MWDKEILDRRHSENKEEDLDPGDNVVTFQTWRKAA